MELKTVWILAQGDLRDALRNRWLWLLGAGFVLLALGLSRAGVAASGYAGLAGFNRTAASLLNALLLLVPLVGLAVGAQTLAPARERGLLAYLLAQPVSRPEAFTGKVVGGSAAVLATLGIGFAVAGIVLARGPGGSAAPYLALVGLTGLLAVASLALGVVASAWAGSAAGATGAAILVWLGLAFAGDLAFVGAALALQPAPPVLLGLLLLNPLQAYKIVALRALGTPPETLGPVGQYAEHQFGAALPLLLIGILLAWILLGLGLAYYRFSREDAA